MKSSTEISNQKVVNDKPTEKDSVVEIKIEEYDEYRIKEWIKITPYNCAYYFINSMVCPPEFWSKLYNNRGAWPLIKPGDIYVSIDPFEEYEEGHHKEYMNSIMWEKEGFLLHLKTELLFHQKNEIFPKQKHQEHKYYIVRKKQYLPPLPLNHLNDNILYNILSYLPLRSFKYLSEVSRYMHCISLAYLNTFFLTSFKSFAPWYFSSPCHFSCFLSSDKRPTTLKSLHKYFTFCLRQGFVTKITEMKSDLRLLFAPLIRSLNRDLNYLLTAPIGDNYLEPLFITMMSQAINEAGPRESQKPIIIAVQEGHIEVVKFLISVGAKITPEMRNIGGFGLLEICVINNDLAMSKLLVQILRKEKYPIKLFDPDHRLFRLCALYASEAVLLFIFEVYI